MFVSPKRTAAVLFYTRTSSTSRYSYPGTSTTCLPSRAWEIQISFRYVRTSWWYHTAPAAHTFCCSLSTRHSLRVQALRTGSAVPCPLIDGMAQYGQHYCCERLRTKMDVRRNFDRRNVTFCSMHAYSTRLLLHFFPFLLFFFFILFSSSFVFPFLSFCFLFQYLSFPTMIISRLSARNSHTAHKSISNNSNHRYVHVYVRIIYLVHVP